MRELVSNNIKRARTARGLSLKGLSDKTGGILSPSRISNYESGRREPGLEDLATISQAINEPIANLVSEGQPIGLNYELLRNIIEMVLNQTKSSVLDIPEEEKARAIVKVYDYFSTRKAPDRAELADIIHLVAA